MVVFSAVKGSVATPIASGTLSHDVKFSFRKRCKGGTREVASSLDFARWMCQDMQAYLSATVSCECLTSVSVVWCKGERAPSKVLFIRFRQPRAIRVWNFPGAM